MRQSRPHPPARLRRLLGALLALPMALAALMGVLISSGSIAITYYLLIENAAKNSLPAIAWIGREHVFNAIIYIAAVGVALSIIPTLLATRRYLRI